MMPTFGLDDPEKKMSSLEQENFDLKLRLYHMKQAERDQKPGIKVEETAEQLADLLETHCVDNMALRESNDTARKRINELESELIQLRIKREGKYTIDATNGSLREMAVVKTAGPLSIVNNPVIDENRRRERQATLAIAQHDAQLIRKLESEVSNLRSQHDSDVSLVNDCAEKIGNLVREVEEKDRLIVAQSAATQQLQGQIDLMRDQLRRHELLIEQQQLQQQLGQKHRLAIDAMADRNRSSSSTGHRDRNGNNNSTSSSPRGSPSPRVASPRGVRATGSRVHNDTRDRDSGGLFNSSSVSNSATMSRPFPIDGKDLLSFGLGTKTRSTLDTITNTEADGSIGSNASPTGESAAVPTDIFQLMDELNTLKQENSRLKQQVARERAMLKGQEEVLNKVRASAEEITLLEAEEIARLEAELDRCNEEKEQWQKKCKAAEGRAEQYRMQILRLEKDLHPSSIPGPPVLPGLSAATDPRIMEMYKQREAELLNALEGVVLRCQDLESRMNQQDGLTPQTSQRSPSPGPIMYGQQTNGSGPPSGYPYEQTHTQTSNGPFGNYNNSSSYNPTSTNNNNSNNNYQQQQPPPPSSSSNGNYGANGLIQRSSSPPGKKAPNSASKAGGARSGGAGNAPRGPSPRRSASPHRTPSSNQHRGLYGNGYR